MGEGDEDLAQDAMMALPSLSLTWSTQNETQGQQLSAEIAAGRENVLQSLLQYTTSRQRAHRRGLPSKATRH